jgi:DNA-binding LacI/PurR family transcriptional regulator
MAMPKDVPSKIATIKDVAARAKVSYQTVSRVINGSPHVLDGTRQRVTEAMELLRYRPNNVARNLVSKRSRVIGFVASITFYGPARIMVSVEQTAKEHGYNIMFSELARVTKEEVRRAIEEMCVRQVDGIVILIPLRLDIDFVREICRNIPFIAIDVDLGPRLPAVLVDQDLGSRLAIDELLRLGHRKIAFISGPQEWRAAKDRQKGWIKALREIEPGPFYSGDWSAKSGYEAALQLIKKHRHDFTAVVAANDHMALGALSAFHEHGIKVPDEVSIIGFDGLPEAEFYQPSLTTIYQDFAALGRVSLEFLLEMIKRPDLPPLRHLEKPIFVPRQSTAKAKRGSAIND